MKDFYEDAKKIKIIVIILFTLVMLVFFSSLVAIVVFKIMKMGTIDLDNFDAIMGFFGIICIIVFLIYLFVKADFSYFIRVKEGKLTLKIKGAEYSYNVNEIDECYLKRVGLWKRVIIKVSGSTLEVSTKKPKRLLKSIESQRERVINT